MYKRILVPVDGSAPSQRGLDEALKLAKALNAQVLLVHVVNELVVSATEASGLYLDKLIEVLRQTGKAVLADAEKLARGAGVVVDSMLIESMGGAAADLIVRQAREWPADLIVMGTHGRRGMRRAVMGSDAEQVLRSAPTPVMLVRSDEGGHQAWSL